MSDIIDFLQGINKEQFKEITKEYGYYMFDIFNTVITILEDIQQKCGDITIVEAKQYILPAILSKIIQKKQSEGTLENEFTKFSDKLVLKEVGEFLKETAEE